MEPFFYHYTQLLWLLDTQAKSEVGQSLLEASLEIAKGSITHQHEKIPTASTLS